MICAHPHTRTERRHRLEDPGIRMGQTDRIAERIAKQRMIVDDQEAGHLLKSDSRRDAVEHRSVIPSPGGHVRCLRTSCVARLGIRLGAQN
jgi:hypothetical protein